MSHSSLAAVSSSNFQLVINNALKVYKKRTKKDLLSLPLASELQACNSSTAILAVLQQQVHGLEPSRSGDDRRTKWLVPTVKVLYTYSATLEERVGLVSPQDIKLSEFYILISLAGILPREIDIFRNWCPSRSAHPLLTSQLG